jgi:hypothetical protein
MKLMKMLLPMSFIISSITLFGQTRQANVRFADSTAVWNQCHTILLEGIQGTFGDDRIDIYRVAQDTFFNNFSYQKIISPSISTSAFVRQDSTKKNLSL